MGRRKAEKSVDFLKIRDAEGRIVTFIVFLEISLGEIPRGFESLSLRQKNDRLNLSFFAFPHSISKLIISVAILAPRRNAYTNIARSLISASSA